MHTAFKKLTNNSLGSIGYSKRFLEIATVTPTALPGLPTTYVRCVRLLNS